MVKSALDVKTYDQWKLKSKSGKLFFIILSRARAHTHKYRYVCQKCIKESVH